MRKLLIIGLTLLLVFTLAFSVSASTGLSSFMADFTEFKTVYHKDTDFQYTYGFDTIYNAYIARRGTDSHLHYVLVKGTTGEEEGSGYLLYSFVNTEENGGKPIYYKDGYLYCRGSTLIYLYDYIKSWIPSNDGWKFVAEDFYDGGSFIMSSSQVLWTSDDILTKDNLVAISGDYLWSDYTTSTEPVLPDSGTDTESDTDKSILGRLKELVNAIVSLPATIADLILNGIKAIFVPDMDEMREQFSNLVNRLSPSTYDDSGTMSGIENATSSEPLDMIATIKLGNSVMGDLTFSRIVLADYDWLKIGIERFRPIINGMISWLLGMFYYKEFLSFIGQAPNMAQASANAESHVKAEQKKASKNKG